MCKNLTFAQSLVPMRHYNIPVFIPELACPNQCVYCNQQKITGKDHFPDAGEADRIIERHLRTLPLTRRKVEIAFFGGNFTGIPLAMQREYLDTASRWMGKNMVDGIRLSTRPDYISEEVIDMLQAFGVSCIELGAQSLDDEVLRLSGRGHTAADVEQAARLILQSGIQLGLQMMIGLPGDTRQKSMQTARKIADLGASQTRIYPTLVIRGTKLEKMMQKGHYKPLSIADAVDWCKELVCWFEENAVRILRLGLHPTEGLITGSELVAGPFHPAMKELVETAIWKDIFEKNLVVGPGDSLHIFVGPGQLNAAIGHHAVNRKLLQKKCRSLRFAIDNQLEGRAFYVHYR